MYCRHCYQQIEDGSEKCPLCGWPQKQIRIALDDSEAKQTMETHIEDTVETTDFPETLDYIYCRKCGNKMPSDSAFCSKCGTPTSKESNAPVHSTSNCAPMVKCSRCGGHHIRYDTVTEDVPAGCSTGCLYVLLALTILGLLIVIPLMLRKKTETVTYAVCLDCGNRWKP